MTENFHIASLVADVPDAKVEAISTAIAALPFVEIPMAGKHGKLVILIDAPSMRDLVNTTDDIRNMEGVLSLLPVYQHDETDPKKEDQNQKTNIGLEKRL